MTTNTNSHTMPVPKLPQFDPEKISFELYQSLIDATFATYSITDQVMKKNLLIVNIGMESYTVLASLTAPDK